MKFYLKYIWFLSLVILFGCCDDDPIVDPTPMDRDLTDIPYDPTPYEIEYPVYTQQIQFQEVKLPQMNIPADNPMTEEGIDLGRHLFYDKVLSADGTQSCASCHLPEGSFTDNEATSMGIDGIRGNRSSMSLLNVGFFDNGLFWDGRVQTLEEQALLPVEDPVELHNEWTKVEELLRVDSFYQEKFRKAFGIEKSSEISKELAAKAIAQFERTINSYESKFDNYLKGIGGLTDDQLWGMKMYFDEQGSGAPDAQCWHCHTLPLLSSNDYFNNGLSEAENWSDFEDPGRGNVSIMMGDSTQFGKFRAPSLRNIGLSAPYMHDGRFETLDEVIDHYLSGGKKSKGKNPLLDEIVDITDYDRMALKEFLLTLTDNKLAMKEELQNPFE